MAVVLCLHNLREHKVIDESDLQHHFLDSGGITNWRVNFISQKSRASCVLGRESLHHYYLLKKIDICKLRLVTQSQWSQ